MHTSEVIYTTIAGGLALVSAIRAASSGPPTRVDCLQCGYPLVDQNAAECPNCGQNPFQISIEPTGAWNVETTLRKRRLTLHVLAVLGLLGMATVLLMAGRFIPRTYHSVGTVTLVPDSEAYRLSLAVKVSYEQSAHEQAASEHSGNRRRQNVRTDLTLTFSPTNPSKGQANRPSKTLQYVTGEADFSYISGNGQFETRPLNKVSLENWYHDELGLSPKDDRKVRDEAHALADWLTGLPTSTLPSYKGVTARASKNLDRFKVETDPATAEDLPDVADGIDPWIFPLLAIAPYLIVFAWIERSHTLRTRALARKHTRQGEWQSGRVLSVLFSDIVEFTKMTVSMPQPELLELLRDYKKEVLASVASRSGRIIKNVGDAYLVTFERPEDALWAGLELQRALRLRNFSVPEYRRFQVRVGINTGPVAEEDGDVFGLTVNTASRVQQELGAPGQVLFTEAVYKLISPTEFHAEKMGGFELKGIPNKVVVYLASESVATGRKKSHGAAN